MRQPYTMTHDDLDEIVGAISAARRTSGMYLSGGMPMSSVQQAANDAWCALGRKMGFDGMSVQPIPGRSQLEFTAIPVPKEGVQ